MNNLENQTSKEPDLVKGLPMFTASDPEALAKEKAELAELGTKGVLQRWKWYFARTGPAWMQSAMTLGGGSAAASLFAGAFLQYKLLWIQPLAMILGIIMLSALSHQTLSTNARPFYAMKRFIHPSLAWAWAIGSLVATIIWHLPQYALAAGMTEDIIKAVTGWQPSPTAQTVLLLVLGIMFLTVAIKISWNYGSGRRGIKILENMLKAMIWMIIFCFLLVVVRRAIAGGIEWGKVFKGFLPLHIPTDMRGVSVLMAAFGAAVGINMTFLFGYSYLARGWGKEHRGLARFDLITGMLIPYILATSLLVIAAGCTIYDILEDFNPADITNLPALAQKLKVDAARDAPSPGRRLHQMLDDDTKTTLEMIALTKMADQNQKTAVVDALNNILKIREFYTQQDFKDIQLPDDAQEILHKDLNSRNDKEIRLLNRHALDAAFPSLINKVQLKVPPTKAAAMFQAAGMGLFFSRIVFGLGIIGMVMNAITMHMLVCGFAACEIFGVEPGGWKYKLACLIPAPAMLGVILWKYMQMWIAIPTSAICGLMLPIAYVGFFLLNNSSKYLAENKPRGTKALVWNIAMLTAIVVSVASAGYYLYAVVWPKLIG